MRPLASADESQLNSHTNLSTSISFSILDQTGNEMSVPITSNHLYEFIIPHDPNVIIPSMTLQNVTSLNSTPFHLLFNLHYINIIQSNNLTISLHIEIQPLNISLAYLFIYKFDSSPQLNSSMNLIDGWSLFCPINLTNDNIYTYFIDNQLTVNHQSFIFGLRELNSTEIDEFCSNQSIINNPPISDKPFNFTSNYQVRTYISGCYYFDSDNNWQSDGLLVGSLTNHMQTQCLSTNIATFASALLFLPSPINWNYVFANAGFIKNKTIYLTIICISCLYILLVIYARYKDKKDIEKLGVTILPDNYKKDQYAYEILVFTGHRKDAGTKSKVQFIVTGEHNQTKVRTFSDPKRKIFQRDGIDAFIMTVPKSLGSLNYIHIWHDNSGGGSASSWFLKYIIVCDLQTLEKSYFICQQWLAVEEDDGRIDRVLPIAGEFQKHEFSYLLSKRVYHNISEGHLWFSILARPPSFEFTRVQRCTSCFTLLFISMLLNILYYDQLATIKLLGTNATGFSIGPFYITLEQIEIGFIVELLTLIPSLLLVAFFRRIRLRPSHQQQVHSLYESRFKIKPHATLNTMVKDDKKKSKLTFPWWCIFIAYSLSFLLAAVSIFFITVRGIEFGDLETQKWLTSLISSFFSSILLIQPMKILLMSVLCACFVRNSDVDKEAAEYLDDNFNINLNNDEEYLHFIEYYNSPFSHRHYTNISRLDKSELVLVRYQRLQEMKMWKIIREILIYLCFLCALNIFVYSNTNSNGFDQTNHLRKFILNSRQINQDYTKISTINEYWNWLEDSFVSNIHAQQWYNGDIPRNLNGFINDKTNRMIGWAIIRQLRIKSHPCQTKQNLFSICEDDYSFSNEEKHSFEPGWINQTTQVYSPSIQQAFKYQDGNQLDSYVYLGKFGRYSAGGYVYEFRGRLIDLQSNLSKLHQLKWIDSQTRAVIIQFSLYNPNANLFTSITLLMEFLSTGSLYPQSRFDPFSFQIFPSISQLICSIIYMIFIIYMMIKQIQSIFHLKMKYFYRFWSYIDIIIIVCSWTSVGIYVWRCVESARIDNLFNETNGYVYVNLEFEVYINDLLTCFISLCCFFGWIKLLRFCRFNRRFVLFIETFQHAKEELISFSFMFSIVFISFICLFYFVFISKLSTCSSLLTTAEMLLQMTLMKFNGFELIDVSSFLEPFCFGLFIFLVVFICLNMFTAIMIHSFRFVHNNAKQNQHKDEQIFTYMFNKFRYWIGKQSGLKISEEQNEEIHIKYYDPIEQFPNKIDQLLAALNRIYMNQQRYKTKKERVISPSLVNLH
ncbi:unnamed protein product [Adineta steineri]|uniref:PLAT domain-containing protein n=1 Tax=Adineta steineri TaxID=433720 RepID=A0A813S6F4_9BILA|nr:unnamed protein product [Adineta steineri]